ncbi:MAG: SDR family NAD(P)-dependent oxidoreductase [Clostridia bacterium]|nr:SDR family NAD(P)-dependent oxidoreductase [Clostridia bacterium]
MRSDTWIKKHAASLSGTKTAITGSTGGLGREICRYIARLGGDLILLDRNAERSGEHARELIRDYGIGVTTINTDLTSPVSLKSAADGLKIIRPDNLILNGAVYAVPRFTCEGGFDNVFQTNFLSHYYLVNELLPVLSETRGRVVAVGSVAYRYSKTRPDDVDFSGQKSSAKVYGNSKRYLMFSLYDLFGEEKGAALSVAHPGISFTGITAHYPKWLFAVIKNPMKLIFMKPKRACLSVIQGLFETCSDCEWIGPRFFDIWGLPKKRVLRDVSGQEKEEIAFRARRALAVFREKTGI